jgi:hypothetical protein
MSEITNRKVSHRKVLSTRHIRIIPGITDKESSLSVINGKMECAHQANGTASITGLSGAFAK